MKSRRTRRESGRSYNKIYDPENGFYNETYWDDWNDYRDGMRNRYGNDKTRLLRVAEANHFKEPEPYTIRNFRTGELIECVDDGFQKIHKNNMKIKKMIHRRHLKQQKYADLMI